MQSRWKPPKSTSDNGLSPGNFEGSDRHHLRPWLIILFAVLLAITTSVVSAQAPLPLNEIPLRSSPSGESSSPVWGDGVVSPSEGVVREVARTVVSMPIVGCPGCGETACQACSASIEDGVTMIPQGRSGMVIPQHRSTNLARPKYAEVSARLASFDSDADPDGWRAEIVLLDEKDRPVTPRAIATFELMPRIFLNDDRMVDARDSPIRWTRQLEFDNAGIAHVKLPLTARLRPSLGWDPGDVRNHRRTTSDPRPLRIWKPRRTFVTLDTEQLLGMPYLGQLRVRVAVPTEGVFEAVTPLQVRPSVLVDTQWPYR